MQSMLNTQCLSLISLTGIHATLLCRPTSPMIHRDRGGVLAGWRQAQQHVTSPPSGRPIGGRLWQTSRVELTADQPQRSIAPCGNQRGTPTNSRKQTIAIRCCKTPMLHYHRWYKSEDFTGERQRICRSLCKKRALNRKTYTEATGGKTAYIPVSL